MIYLIGGPPKCGKTTLAKKMSRDLGIPWLSADTLQVVARQYMSDEDSVRLFPWSVIRSERKFGGNDPAYARHSAAAIVKMYAVQARATFDAIEMVVACEIADGNDYIIEGYQVEPRLVAKLVKKYGAANIRAAFVVRTDVDAFVRDVKKSSTPNDWILKGTHDEATFSKIGAMISVYGKYFVKEAKKYKQAVFSTDEQFEKQLVGVEKYLVGK